MKPAIVTEAISRASGSQRMQQVQEPVVPVIAALIRENPGTLSLGQGVVGYGPPHAAMARMMESIPSCHAYGPVQGLPELRAVLAEKLARENGIACDPDQQIMITAGGNMAFLNALLAIAEPGDEILLPVPYYFNHEMAITMLGLKPVPVATTRGFRLDLEAIERAITPRTRALVTVSPNNPSGVVYGEDELRAANELCGRRGLYHVSDEAYEYFVYDGARHVSPASLPGAAGHTISLYSLSKAYGFAGWRIGYLVFPPHLMSGLLKIQDTNLICPTIASQYAALGALSAGRAYCQQGLVRIETNRAAMRTAIRDIRRLTRQPPAEGAFYLLLELDSKLPPMELAARLIREHRVAALPGDTFGLDGCHLRIAYGALDPDDARQGIERLVQGLNTLLN